MSWVGGKKALRDEILPRFPLDYKRYIEVFGGGGWVLFHKNPGKDFEIYNDFNGDLVNLYRCVREYPTQLMDELTFVLNARLDFEYMKEVLHTKAVLPDIRRAAYFYALIRYSYASGTDSFGGQPHAMWRNFPLITSAAKRLQTVVIENRDFQKLIQQNNRPESFFYCDPPYYKTEACYKGGGFGRQDHARLAETLLGISGKFLLSYNDCPEIEQLYTHPGIYIERVSRLSNIAQRYEPGCQYPELLISNYDTSERKRSIAQLSIFDALEDTPTILLKERNMTYEEKCA